MSPITAPDDRNPYVVPTDPERSRAKRLQLFADEVYGTVPPGQVDLQWHIARETRLPDDSVRRQVVLELSTDRGTKAITLLVHLPPVAARGGHGVPVFLGMNFRGNHACAGDSDILDLTESEEESYGDPLDYRGLREAFTVPVVRGSQSSRWDIETVIARGYAVITWSYLQVGPDAPEIFARGPHRLFGNTDLSSRAPSDWGATGMWAWSMSRVLDAVIDGMVPEIDPSAVIAHGHSRLGKTALWAAASDDRFAAVISNNSGALGAALSRPVGETPEVLARIRPQWFARRFSDLIMASEPLPVDQWELLAAIAPRPLYVSSASEDHNADPEGEFLAWQRASAAWTGGAEATAGDFPTPDTVLQPEHVPLGYHLRKGAHTVEAYDWAAWLDWADRWVQPETNSLA